MRYTEIDGEKYEVKECESCPFRDMGDGGWGAHCTHPKVSQDPRTPLKIDYGGDIAEGCPLRDVKDQYLSMEDIFKKMLRVQMGKGVIHVIRPCPFCGSTNLSEHHFNDEGEELEEWMMEEANNDGCDYKSWQEYLDTNGYVFMIGCTECHGSVTSKDNIEDAWAKWNKRV